MWIETFWKSRLIFGTVGIDWSSTPLLFWSTIGWLGESMLPTLTGAPNTTLATRLFSQLAGPVKRTTHGLGCCAPEQIATALVTLQPGAGLATTWTVRSLVWSVSMSAMIGLGFWTVTCEGGS